MVTRRADEFLDAEGVSYLNEAVMEIERQMSSGARGTRRPNNSQGKDYLDSLLPREFDLQSPFLRLAIHRSFLSVANEYLGLRSSLRAINVWLNRPTSEMPKESQLWHRDGDDRMILKVFIYLVDVDLGNGPFWFIPETHRWRSKRGFPCEGGARLEDHEMRRCIPESQWNVCTGPSRTVIFADTTGFHKGGKCNERPRLLLTFEYVSGVSPYPREFTFVADRRLSALDPVQQSALAS